MKIMDYLEPVGKGGRYSDLLPVGARFPASVQTGPGAHPASCTAGTGYLSQG